MDDVAKKTVRPGRGILLMLAVGVLFLVMLYFFYFYPHRAIGPKQPIYFSHRVHAGVKKINCRFCHPFVGRSRKAGIPAVGKCLFCHKYIITQHPQIKKLRAHFEKKIPIPWVRIFYVPDHVQFNHERHIKKEIDCSQCHGDVKKRDRLVQVKFKMGFCVECHKQRGAQLDCWLACHE